MDIPRNQKLIWIFTLIGAIYDLILGILLIIMPLEMAALMNLSQIPPVILSQTLGLFLIIIGWLLLYSLQDLEKMFIIPAGSMLLRFCYAVLVIITVFMGTTETGYLMVAATDAITGILILIGLLKMESFSFRRIIFFKNE